MKAPAAVGAFYLRALSTRARQSTHSGQPPDPYRCVGCPQPVHGPM